MLRIVFSDLDLARTTVADGPSPAVELFASLRLLQHPYPPRRFAAWRDNVRVGFDPGHRILTELVPASGYGVTFLDPNPVARAPVDTVDHFAVTPPDVIHTEVAGLIARRRPISRLGLHLADGRPAAVAAVGAAIHGYHAAAITPTWDTVRRVIDLDLARRARIMLRGGVTELLATLGPAFGWRFPTLSVRLPGNSANFEVRLNGQGLLLQPSFFVHSHPVIWNFEQPRPTIVYPVAPVADATAPATDALGDLLGRTRAEILLAIAATGGRTTTDLARALDVSAAAVSQHTAVLRKAGLIVTLRQGRAVLHTATPHAAVLLEAS